MIDRLSTVVQLAHDLLLPILPQVRLAVDATAGNGTDTLFLAANLPAAAQLYALDIQPTALAHTARLLTEHGLRDRAVLCQIGHEEIAQLLSEPLDLVIFNLGYLPGGDHAVATRAETTLQALQAALGKLTTGGRIVITVYPGHEAGKQERQVITAFLSELRQVDFKVLQLQFINASAEGPFIILIEKTVR